MWRQRWNKFKSKNKQPLQRCSEVEWNGIPADLYFAQRDHDFNTDATFTIIEQLQNTELSKDSIYLENSENCPSETT